MLKIIYEDHDILVAEKPAGLESQASRGFEKSGVIQVVHKAVHKIVHTACGALCRSYPQTGQACRGNHGLR